jgi:hypothetical protein
MSTRVLICLALHCAVLSHQCLLVFATLDFQLLLPVTLYFRLFLSFQLVHSSIALSLKTRQPSLVCLAQDDAGQSRSRSPLKRRRANSLEPSVTPLLAQAIRPQKQKQKAKQKQKQAQAQEIDTSQIVGTHTDSLEVVNLLLTTGIGCITFLRGIFPERTFGTDKCVLRSSSCSFPTFQPPSLHYPPLEPLYSCSCHPYTAIDLASSPSQR